MFRRYAVYYTPEPGTALADFGAAWLGWDSATGQKCSQSRWDGIDVATITQTPRKYGFHGTIKPPFRLAANCTEAALSEALAALAAQAPPVALAGLELARLGRFLALVPTGDAGALAALAASVVQNLDMFRAAPSDAELAKRRGARLSPAQEANLVAWGYPYVLDQFRFHMTLTGPLDAPLRTKAHAALQAPLSVLDLAPYRMTGLTLLGEDETGLFHQIRRYPLLG